MPKIDEDFMREVISQGVPGKLDGGKPDDMPQEAQAEKPTPRKRKNSPGDYRETYFRKVELTDRQPLYVSRTTHEKLMRIVSHDDNLLHHHRIGCVLPCPVGLVSTCG